MKARAFSRGPLQRIACLGLALLLALLSFFATINALVAVDDQPAAAASDGAPLYLAAVNASEAPAGSYYCYEYEFGMIWSADVITLNSDGTSEYEYCHPYMDSPTGTWSYTYSMRQVGFTGFRWVTATFDAPDRLWARRYLPHVGFEIAIQCYRTEEPRSCSSGP